MANVKEAFGGASASFTIDLNSLANSSARESTALDNTSGLYLDAHISVRVTLASGSPANDKAVYIYAYGSEDGTNYTDNATGSDAAITLRNPPNARLVGSIWTPDSGGLLYKSHPFAVATAFGGILPRKWGIIVENRSGVALHTSGHSATYSLIYSTIA